MCNNQADGELELEAEFFDNAILSRPGESLVGVVQRERNAHVAAVDHAHEILKRLHYYRDGDYFVNVTRVGAEAIHVSTVATIVSAALATTH